MNIAIILSGGTGSRVRSNIPKQYLCVNNKMIISYCLETFEKNGFIDGIWIVAAGEWQETIRKSFSGTKLKGFSLPGNTRQLSIWNALCDIKDMIGEEDKVIIHDGARPLVSDELIEELIVKTKKYDGAIPVLPMKDTVYLYDGQEVTGLLDRDKLCAGQSPECFVYGKYYRANERLFPDEILGIAGATQPAIMAGMKMVAIDGDEMNFKITTAVDLDRFREICSGSKSLF